MYIDRQETIKIIEINLWQCTWNSWFYFYVKHVYQRYPFSSVQNYFIKFTKSINIQYMISSTWAKQKNPLMWHVIRRRH